jgi:methyl coenzyme M reductase gamma subunit
VFSFREWWSNAQRVGAQKAVAEADAAHKRVTAGVRSLRDLSDDELIAKVGPRNTFTSPVEEMEMQRRLKDAVLAQIAESRRGRIWGAWGTVVMALLAIVGIALTVVLIKHG